MRAGSPPPRRRPAPDDPDWIEWMGSRPGRGEGLASKKGDGELKPTGDAPGEYMWVKA